MAVACPSTVRSFTRYPQLFCSCISAELCARLDRHHSLPFELSNSFCRCQQSSVPRHVEIVRSRLIVSAELRQAKSRKRARVVGCGLSIIIHAVAAALLSSWPRLSATVGPAEGPQTVLILEEREAEARSSKEPSTAAPFVGPSPLSHLVTTNRRRIAQPSVVVTGPDPRSDDDLGRARAREAVALRDHEGGGDGFEEHPAEAPAIARRAPLLPAKIDGFPRQPARRSLSPGLARALRVFDTFPRSPEGMSLAHANVVVEVCVSDQGAVSNVIARGATGSFNDTVRRAILTWRYRPFTVNGAPTPFCHLMRISYGMN